MGQVAAAAAPQSAPAKKQASSPYSINGKSVTQEEYQEFRNKLNFPSHFDDERHPGGGPTKFKCSFCLA